MGLNPGDTLQGGKYTIEERLSIGLTSISYLAKHSDGSRWIIKALDPQILVGLSEEERDRIKTLFKQEAGKLIQCSGTPHIVKSKRLFEEEGLDYLPVEYLSRDSLAKRPQPMLKESVALDYIRQVGTALTVVHGQGLVHRDIRPSNIFLRIDGNQANAVLAGFGLAVDCDTELTRTRTRERIDGFSPYELYGHGQVVGAYTDVYSLAATLYELLTGLVPVSAMERKTGVKALVSPQMKNPAITDNTVRAIEAGMVVWPTSERPQSVADWLMMLDAESQTSPQASAPNSVKVEAKPKTVPNTAKKPVDWAKWLGVIAAFLAVFVPVVMWRMDKMEGESEVDVIAPVEVEESPQPPREKDAEQVPGSLNTAP